MSDLDRHQLRPLLDRVAGGDREALNDLFARLRPYLHSIVRKTLVIAEVALSLMLLAGSSVLLRTFMAMENIDLGVPPEQVLTMRVPLPAQRYPDARRRIAFFQELLARVRAAPGVAAAGLNSGLHPLGNMRTPAEVRGEPPNNEPVQVHQINADYTNALGIRLAAGRMLTDTDVERVQQVALVNEGPVTLLLDA